MRGRGWIKALRQNEAQQVRARIAELERDLMATSPQGRHRRYEAGHELRSAKFRLKRLEECIAEIPEKAER
jgi:predicted  nucleic acid-binding Zn-ribbon protein